MAGKKTTSSSRSSGKTTTPRAPSILSLSEAAELFGVRPDQLELNRARGLSPGIDGFKRDGVLVWNRKDVEAAIKARDSA